MVVVVIGDESGATSHCVLPRFFFWLFFWFKKKSVFV
jgi:hypothetical protein